MCMCIPPVTGSLYMCIGIPLVTSRSGMTCQDNTRIEGFTGLEVSKTHASDVEMSKDAAVQQVLGMASLSGYSNAVFQNVGGGALAPGASSRAAVSGVEASNMDEMMIERDVDIDDDDDDCDADDEDDAAVDDDVDDDDVDDHGDADYDGDDDDEADDEDNDDDDDGHDGEDDDDDDDDDDYHGDDDDDDDEDDDGAGNDMYVHMSRQPAYVYERAHEPAAGYT
eukprot:6554508-Karenia_brevis.AAC.1